MALPPANAVTPQLKLEHMLLRFDGTGDVVIWLEKVALVCDMQGYGDPICVVPLLLEGAAYAVFKQLEPASKKRMQDVKAALLRAFAMDPYDAFQLFKHRTWRDGESVDVYLVELQRLLELAEVSGAEVILRAFVTGLPTDVSRDLRTFLHSTPKASLDVVAAQARVLMAGKVACSSSFAMVASNNSSAAPLNPGAPPPSNKFSSQGGGQEAQGRRCYLCNDPSHVKVNCPNRPPMKCFRCNKDGHTSRFCPATHPAGNGGGRA